MADIQQKPKIEDDPSILENLRKLVSTSFDGGAVVITMGTARIFPERVDEMPRTKLS
jgi:hypothetical protein